MVGCPECEEGGVRRRRKESAVREKSDIGAVPRATSENISLWNAFWTVNTKRAFWAAGLEKKTRCRPCVPALAAVCIMQRR